MIYTVTLNPSLDRVIWVGELKTDDSMRIKNEAHYAGGKGIDSSRVIKTLSQDTTASGFLGSFNGLQLEGLLINEGVQCDFIKISQETRSNVIVFSENSGGHLSFNSKGPEITPYDLAILFNKITALPSNIFMVHLAGSLPQGVSENIYGQLIYALRQNGLKVALDADNEALRYGVKAKPYLIKPNNHEFARLIGRELKDDDDILRSARELLQQFGIEIILLTMGSKGLFVISPDKSFRVKAPQIEVRSTIGSGDSALAAFMCGLELEYSLAECAMMAVAAGAATAMSPGVELVRIEDYRTLLKGVQCENLN